jgi:hypothetical protein
MIVDVLALRATLAWLTRHPRRPSRLMLCLGAVFVKLASRSASSVHPITSALRVSESPPHDAVPFAMVT